MKAILFLMSVFMFTSAQASFFVDEGWDADLLEENCAVVDEEFGRCLVSAWEDDFGQELQVPEGKEVSVHGDGHEWGFSFDLQVWSDDGAAPQVSSFVDDDSADCDVSVSENDRLQSQFSPKTLYIYNVSVGTSVNGDSGGCTVHVTDGNADILKTVHYAYTTDF